MTGYVYTIAAVRARLRRGHRSVRLFWPETGVLVRVTRRNLKSIARRWAAEIADGHAAPLPMRTIHRLSRSDMPDRGLIARYGLAVARLIKDGNAVVCGECSGIIELTVLERVDRNKPAHAEDLEKVPVLACSGCEFIHEVSKIVRSR